MNKRGISYNMVLWIPKLVYLIIVFVVAFGLIFAYTATKVSVGDVEAHIFMQRLHLSPDGISRVDTETGRVYTGMVDPAKLTKEKLETALDTGEGDAAMRMELYPLGSDDERTAYLHENTYKNWQPIAILVDQKSPVEGSGLKFPYKEVRYVYASQPARLETVVIMPNE